MCHGVTIERSRFNCAIGRRKVRQIFVRRSRHEKFKNAIFYSQDVSLYMYKIFERKFGWKIYKEPGYAIGLHIPSYHNHVTDTDPWNKQHTRHSSNLLRFRSFPTSSVSCRPLFPRLLHTASQLPVPAGANLIKTRILPTQYILYKYRGSLVSINELISYLYRSNSHIKASNGRR